MGLPSKTTSVAAGLPCPDETSPMCWDRAATGNCSSSWKSLNHTQNPHCKIIWFGNGAVLESETRAAQVGLCRPRFMGEKSLRFGFETRPTWFFRSPTALFPTGKLLGARLFQKLMLFVWDPKTRWVTGSFRSTQVT